LYIFLTLADGGEWYGALVSRRSHNLSQEFLRLLLLVYFLYIGSTVDAVSATALDKLRDTNIHGSISENALHGITILDPQRYSALSARENIVCLIVLDFCLWLGTSIF